MPIRTKIAVNEKRNLVQFLFSAFHEKFLKTNFPSQRAQRGVPRVQVYKERNSLTFSPSITPIRGLSFLPSSSPPPPPLPPILDVASPILLHSHYRTFVRGANLPDKHLTPATPARPTTLAPTPTDVLLKSLPGL